MPHGEQQGDFLLLHQLAGSPALFSQLRVGAPQPHNNQKKRNGFKGGTAGQTITVRRTTRESLK